jgi:hypothetical protein
MSFEEIGSWITLPLPGDEEDVASREAAEECSPRSKAWVIEWKKNKPRRGERTVLSFLLLAIPFQRCRKSGEGMPAHRSCRKNGEDAYNRGRAALQRRVSA